MSTPSANPPTYPPPGQSPAPRRSFPWLGVFIAAALALMTLFAGVAMLAVLFLNGAFARHPPPVGDTPPVSQAPAPAAPEPAPLDAATPPERPAPGGPSPAAVADHEPLRRASPPSDRERRDPDQVPVPRPAAERTRAPAPPAEDAGARQPSPVRAGGAIPPPTKTRDVRPEYPLIAQRARVQGVVILEARIGTTGKVEDLRVLRSIPLLDQSAIDAVRQWEYEPTLVNGVPVPVLVTVTVNFRLQ
jgi:protein TonB